MTYLSNSRSELRPTNPPCHYSIHPTWIVIVGRLRRDPAASSRGMSSATIPGVPSHSPSYQDKAASAKPVGSLDLSSHCTIRSLVFMSYGDAFSLARQSPVGESKTPLLVFLRCFFRTSVMRFGTWLMVDLPGGVLFQVHPAGYNVSLMFLWRRASSAMMVN